MESLNVIIYRRECGILTVHICTDCCLSNPELHKDIPLDVYACHVGVEDMRHMAVSYAIEMFKAHEETLNDAQTDDTA